MTNEHLAQRVEVTFVGHPPANRLERASGVSDLEVDGRIVRCNVLGSFQPFLEALAGYEVVTFTSLPESIRRRHEAASPKETSE